METLALLEGGVVAVAALFAVEESEPLLKIKVSLPSRRRVVGAIPPSM